MNGYPETPGWRAGLAETSQLAAEFVAPSVNVAMIPALRTALADAEAQAVALGWLPGANR